MEAVESLDQPVRPSRRPKVYPAREYEPIDVPLADLFDSNGRLHLNTEVEAKGYFAIQLIKGKVRLQARGFVGLIPLNDRVVIDVKPRVPVKNLPRLLRISGYVPPYLGAERTYAADPTWNDSLVDLFATWLVDRVDAIASGGIYRGYERREETSSFPRGRVLINPTVTQLRARNIRHQAVSTRFERTVDNPANRCIKYAIWFMADRLSALGSRTALRRRLLQRLSSLYELFVSVPLDHSLVFLSDPFVAGSRPLPSLRYYYRPALDLAGTIIRRHAVDAEAKTRLVDLPSMILDMEKIFEGYLRNCLRAESSQFGVDFEVLDGNSSGKKPLFDAPPSEDATPDIVCRTKDDRWPLVVEVKCVPAKDGSSRDAIEQAITYAATYRCSRVVLAHPKAHRQSSTGLQLQGEIGPLSVYQYMFDLSVADLAVEERRFVKAMIDLT